MKACIQESNLAVLQLLEHTLTSHGHQVMVADIENPGWKILTNNQDTKLIIIDADVEYVNILQVLKDMKRSGRRFVSFLYGSRPMPDAVRLMEDMGTKVIYKTEITLCLQQEGVISKR